MNRLAGLRPRITLLTAGVVVICVAIAFAAVYERTDRGLTSRADEDLRSEMADLQHVVRAGSHEPDALVERAQAYLGRQPFQPTSHVIFVVPRGRRPVTNEPELLGIESDDDPPNVSDEAAEHAAARRFLASPIGSSEPRLPEAGRVRLLVVEIRSGGRAIARIGIGEPTAARDRAADVVLDGFLLAGALAVLGALIGGFAIATRIVAPLRRMAAVTTRVDGGDLSPRMGTGGRRDEVRALADSFDLMLNRLQDAFDRQGAFVADASHELRTPLTVIRGQLEVLALEAHPAREHVQRVARMVGVEVERMERLVEDLLVLAQADEPSFLRRVPVDLADYLRDLSDGLFNTADRRFELGPVPIRVLDVDPDRMAQALRNLIRNAIAHTRPGGLVHLSAEQRGDTVLIVVDDDGPGIPEDQRARIFDRFQRADSGRARATGGAGLGLAIARAIVVAHGGQIEIADAPAGGARFVVELPVAVTALSAAPCAAPRRGG
ncbi:MAG: two-component system, OmpR family, sensor kinase [Solirubrobacteraceae bacterium]|nr:two-component system, OmpR family, sensor kinase [Solirubrobacteraceae bacterium]